jgi:hypothetical protein
MELISLSNPRVFLIGFDLAETLFILSLTVCVIFFGFYSVLDTDIFSVFYSSSDEFLFAVSVPDRVLS